MKSLFSIIAFVTALALFPAKIMALGAVYLHALASARGLPVAPMALGFNTLTGLFGDIYAAMDTVARELVGFIPAVARNSAAARLALNTDITSPVTPASTASDVTPAMALPEASYQTIGTKKLRLQKSRGVTFSWTGQEQTQLNTAGVPQPVILKDQFAQAMRTLVNEIETDLAVAAKNSASRAYGTAGTTPFDATNKLAFTAQMGKILTDNGCPLNDRHLILDTTAGAAVRTLTQLTNVAEAGDDTLLRQGVLGRIHNFDLRESGQVPTVAAGTAASSTTNNAGYAIGATTITLAAAGTGTLVAGDVITITGDANKYVVATGNADVSAGGTIVLAAPGLRQAIPASAKAITVSGASARNIAFQREAIQLATRLPMLPAQGDLATDRMIITDDVSGLSFEVSIYPGRRMITFEVAIAWGVAVTKSENVAVLLG